jgi:hypothetical protein
MSKEILFFKPNDINREIFSEYNKYLCMMILDDIEGWMAEKTNIMMTLPDITTMNMLKCLLQP